MTKRADWPAHLRTHSGLPGPRGNLTLAQSFADEGTASDFDEVIATDEEYLVLCGVIGLGRLVAEQPDRLLETRLHQHASDQRWRVREGVAMALQRLGDADPERLVALAKAWAADTDPLVQRAAIAGICEPRLLKRQETAAAALRICADVTSSLARRPADERRSDPVRALRKALGYCWSVAVAADPATGLLAFKALKASEADADVAWIVRENSKKVRLAKLLPAPGP
ncbi:HEAT repeat domain-containing protein [Flindersiella endophytica]